MNNISDTAVDMNVINVFMLETINRFLDFSKAQKGLQLVPKKETFDLCDTLSLPIECIQTIQSRIVIEDISIADNICSHIIADKQWLQENILCLLSNGVKYSHQGSIKVSVGLISNISDLPFNTVTTSTSTLTSSYTATRSTCSITNLLSKKAIVVEIVIVRVLVVLHCK
jgi:signal transduction histidine kinase